MAGRCKKQIQLNNTVFRSRLFSPIPWPHIPILFHIERVGSHAPISRAPPSDWNAQIQRVQIVKIGNLKRLQQDKC